MQYSRSLTGFIFWIIIEPPFNLRTAFYIQHNELFTKFRQFRVVVVNGQTQGNQNVVSCRIIFEILTVYIAALQTQKKKEIWATLIVKNFNKIQFQIQISIFVGFWCWLNILRYILTRFFLQNEFNFQFQESNLISTYL